MTKRFAEASKTIMAPNAHQLSALSRLFSSTVFRELAVRGRSALFARLLKESSLVDACSSVARVADAFEAAFSVLRCGQHRDEYVYKAALTQKVLLGTHSLATACMMHEFRVGGCKADLAILNGTATVYEVKSERDSLSRLEKQIETYKKFFASVVVIAGENHVDAVLASTSGDVGIMSLSKRHQLSTLRRAENRPDRICPITVFEAIRTNEAKLILARLGIAVPKVPNTLAHSELRNCFRMLRPQDVHFEMVRTLKHTRALVPLSYLVDRLPPSLCATALSVPVRKCDQDRLIRAVNTGIKEAMEWA